MKILVVPDVHGTHEWEKVIRQINEVDRVIFLGDYVDSWNNKWPDQGENLKRIIEFAGNHDNVDLLIGNHDWSYITPTGDGKYTSGHQFNHIAEISKLLFDNLDIFKVAVKYDDWVFSHAGFTRQWVENFLYRKGLKSDISDEELIEQVNVSMRDRETRTIAYILDWYGVFDGSGNESTQGPLWVRPEALIKNAYFKKQLVGHTEIVEGVDFFAKKSDNLLVVKDSEKHDKIDIFDTEKEYEFFSLMELAKKAKKALKEINDKKSLDGMNHP